MQGNDLFRTRSVWSIIARMSVPALVSIVVMLLYNMTDMYFVARTGDDAQVAAVSLVMPVFTVLMACQRRFEIVRKRRRNFVIFRRRGVTKIRYCLAQKECSRFAVSGA